MRTPHDTKIERYIRYTIIGAIIVLVVLSCLLVVNYRALRRAQVLSGRELWLSLVLKNHGSLHAAGVNTIRSWMTFDYIDKLFNVPSNYLKTQLSITDSRYPRLSLEGYAKSNHLDTASFIGQVENTLSNYLAAASSTNATTSVPE